MSLKLGVSIINDDSKQLLAITKKLGNHFIEVGLFDDRIAELEKGYYNEFGTGTIPERSFIRSTFYEQLPIVIAILNKDIQSIIFGKMTMETCVAKIGILCVAKVKEKIENINTPANASSTAKKKGFNNPLVDTGDMKESIGFRVNGGIIVR